MSSNTTGCCWETLEETAAFPTSPGPTPVDISCHCEVPYLGHSAGPSAAQQTVPGSNVPRVRQKKITAKQSLALMTFIKGMWKGPFLGRELG